MKHKTTNHPMIIGGIMLLVIVIVLAAGRLSHTTAPSSLQGTSSGDNGATYNTVPTNNKKTAPDFSLSKLGGGTITLSEYTGKKPVVLDFWASWCPNCRRDMPNLNRFYKQYKDRVEIIGVNLQESESTVQDFISSRGITFPIALDPEGQVSNAYGNRYTNTHVLIDKDGNLVRTVEGDIQESDIASLIP